MKIGIFAKTFSRPTIDELFQAIASYGIYSVQFNMSCAGLETFPGNVSSDLVQRITDAAEQATVELAAISGTFNMAHPDPAVWRDGLIKFEILCEVTARLRIPMGPRRDPRAPKRLPCSPSPLKWRLETIKRRENRRGWSHRRQQSAVSRDSGILGRKPPSSHRSKSKGVASVSSGTGE